MFRWIREWWNADRIRFTPGHCRLFQLTVGNRVLVRNRLWVVLDRQATPCELQFRLAEFDEPRPESASLRVVLGSSETRLPTVDWSEPGWCDILLEGEIVVVVGS